ncbi:MAG: DNA polymerase I [Clostridia bacterium]|nr:DNA polymerase I [Clostridia bacterium]
MRLLIIDGNSILNRAFYGIKVLTTHDGVPTNALVGFLNIYFRLLEQTEADAVAVAFDRKAPTFRHQLYDAYKAGRKGMPEELSQQLPLIKELLTYMGCTVVEQDGYEADDILGTLSATAQAQGVPCYIATGDRDSLQLVGENVTVLLAATRMGKPETVVFDPAAVHEKYGLTPDALIDLKALMGDTSDNIPGVPGVGEKTALDLLHQFGTLDGVYDHLGDVRESLRRKLEDGKESAYLSRRLGEICRTMPMDTELSHYALRPLQKAELASLMTRLELFKIMERLELDGVVVPQQAAQPTTLKTVSFDELTTNGAFTVWLQDETAYVTAGDAMAVVLASSPKFLDFLENPVVSKRTADTKALAAHALSYHRTLSNVTMDAVLAAYLLNPLASAYELPRLAQEYGVAVPEGDQPLEARLLSPLCDKLEEEIHAAEQDSLLREMEIPLSMVLASMEQVGFAVDGEGVAAFGDMLEEQLNTLITSIEEQVGYSFNLNSPKQLAKALFEDLGLPAKKKTKSGYSTNAEVLEGLRLAHPVVDMILMYRTLSKLKSTYCDGLLKVIAPDGRIYTSFNQTETRTGRISSTEPNLQNIPVRQELGRELRRFFRAKEGYVLCDADYSQIELRVLAALSGDKTMVDAFNNEEDIHRITASQVFDVPEELVTPLMRSQAKAVNFGIVYGIGAHSLSEDIHVSYGEAKRYIEQYLAHYSAVAGYMDELIETAKQTGYAATLFNRRRPLPELRVSNHMTRAFGERVARNMPIQGTAADIIKFAMIRVHDRLRREQVDAKLILQVHDELIVEASEGDADRVETILREEMEQAVTLSVRLRADVHTGKTWYDAKS